MLPYIIFREHIIEVWEDPESHTGFQWNNSALVTSPFRTGGTWPGIGWCYSCFVVFETTEKMKLLTQTPIEVKKERKKEKFCCFCLFVFPYCSEFPTSIASNCLIPESNWWGS
jgi:hypothetical protein